MAQVTGKDYEKETGNQLRLVKKGYKDELEVTSCKNLKKTGIYKIKAKTYLKS